MASTRQSLDKALFEAITGGELAAVAAALQAGADPNAVRRKQSALASALALRREEAARLLLAAGADAGTAREHILWAATEPPETLRRFLDGGADPDAQAFIGRPLQVAARKGLVAQIDMLLEAGADPDAGTMIGNALTDALREGQNDCALALLRGGATVAAADAFGPLLPHLVELGQTALLPALLDAGADPGTRYTLRGPHPRTQLEQAARARENLAALASSLENDEPLGWDDEDESTEDDDEPWEDFEARMNANMDDAVHAATAVRHAGATLLMIAAAEGDVATVRLLLERGADRHVQDDRGRTAADLAIAAGHTDVATALGGSNDGAAQPADPAQALAIAAERGDVDAVVGALLAGAGIDAHDTRRSTEGQTALTLAVRGGNLAAVRALIEHGATLDLAALPSPHDLRAIVDNESQARTPLHWAAALGALDITEMMLAAGATVDARDERKATPLHLAAVGGHAAVIATLASHGARVDVKDNDFYTPLIHAAARNHPEAARALLDAGADVDASTRGKDTALHYAVSNRNADLVRMLVESGANPSAENKYGASPRARAAAYPKLVAALATPARARTKAGSKANSGKARR